MKLRNKTIRVFLSSTFEDLKMERDALQQKAFRNLREYCRERGWQFQAVDLRWGINNEATIDQRTMEICLREIARCQEQSPRPNFIVLLGERYGWRPLPDRILQSVAILMEKEMPSEIHSIFRQWYELDENQLPEPVWKLRAREGRYIDYNEYEKTIQKPLVEFFTQWSAENLPDPELLENKTNPLALQRLSMERSATEQEIQAGAFGVEDAREHVFAFFRNMPDCPKENSIWYDSDQNPINRLRSHLKNYLNEANISDFSAKWDKEKNQPDTAHLENLSIEVENCLKAIIDREIESYELTSEHELEHAAHEAFASERTFGFSGRENDIAAICQYATQSNNTLFVVWGESGTGKSTLMAMAARKVQETLPHTHVITRFIGVTGKSANGHTLLADISRNLCMLYGGEPAEIPEDHAKLQYAFREYLAKATEEHPLILFLDALDQINERDTACLLQWLPEILPLNVKLITSTLKGVSLDVLNKRKEPVPIFYEITPLTSEDGRNALTAWLKRSNRTLQIHQTEQIIKNFEYAGCAPLYLHLAFEEAQYWESYARRQRLGRDIPEMIEEFYCNLSRPEAHGSIVEKVLTAIRCAKQGLSDDEILGVLATDDEFWNSFGIQTYHIYNNREKKGTTSRLIPPVLWIRLYHDLEFYLTRRNAPGGEVITFYHRQLAEAVDNIYLQRPGIRQKRHKDLANFFAGKRLLIKEAPPLIANIRVCDELPWLLTKGEDWDTLTNTLCNLDFIQAKATAKMTYDLVNDFNTALEVIPENALIILEEKERQIRMNLYTKDLISYANGEIIELDIPKSILPKNIKLINEEIKKIKDCPTSIEYLKEFLIFIGREASNLQAYANMFQYFSIQLAWNFAKDGPVGKAAEKDSQKDLNDIICLSQPFRKKWMPLAIEIMSLKGHTSDINSISITANGKNAISGSSDKTCIHWDLNNGDIKYKINKHHSIINSVAITPDGKTIISCSSDQTCLHWSLDSKKAIHILKEHSSIVNSIDITPNGKKAISGSTDKTCILWDLLKGEVIQILVGHSSSVRVVSITADGNKAITGSDDNKCIVWNLKNGNPILKFTGHSSSIRAIAITPNGEKALSASRDNTIILWDIKTGNIEYELKGHDNYIQDIAITPDGNIGLSCSKDNTCILWDLKKGNSITKFIGHIASVNSVALTPDGKNAITASSDKYCILWDLSNINIVQSLSHSNIPLKTLNKWVFQKLKNNEKINFFNTVLFLQEIIINLNKKWTISITNKLIYITWYIERKITIIYLKKYYSEIKSIVISPCEKNVIVGYEDKTFLLWDFTTLYNFKKLNKHIGLINSIIFTPDGKTVISSFIDNHYFHWNINDENSRLYINISINPIKTQVVTPDGRKIFSCSIDKQCFLWNLKTKEIINIYKGLKSIVTTVAIFPDGEKAILCSINKICILLDIYNGIELARFSTNFIVKLARFSSKGLLLHSSNEEFLLIEKDFFFLKSIIITIRQIWDFELQHFKKPSADCPLCGHRFAPPTSVLNTIEEITKKAGLKPEQSPCLELPDDAWEESGLLGNCPSCGEKLKFNPFIAGGE